MEDLKNTKELDINIAETKQLSFGERLVGLTFNPSNDDKVGKAKRLCADLADLLNDTKMQQETSQMHELLFRHTIGEILNAQMNVVKVLTLKY
jgi:hypothetical protein